MILNITRYYYEESEDELDDYSRKPVPILLSILLVIVYIVGGAFLFQMWEGWSFLDRSSVFLNSFFLLNPQRLFLFHHPDHHWIWRPDS